MKRTIAFLLLFSPLLIARTIAYDATIRVGGLDIPFSFTLSGDAQGAVGSFWNGDQAVPSTSGHEDADSLTLRWDYLGTRLQAVKTKDGLDGQYFGSVGPKDKGPHPFHAVVVGLGSREGDPNAPQIGGLWIIPTNSSKGEKAWRFVVQQKDSNVSAAILRVDGDTGAITGSYRDGKFVLSHFDGFRPNVMEVKLAADGSLDILQNNKTKLMAVREEVAEAKGIPVPADPTKHTGVKDPSEAFRFSFTNLNGKLVSNTDEHFHNKVVLVEITGSWCPNCHDEAPFLVEMYKKYHARGLEIVALDFEEPDQLQNPERLRAFVKRYGIEYDMLLGGEQDDAKVKLTQTENWNAWPTTFFLGRDGRVKSVHAGFPSNGSGMLYTQAKADFAAKVEELLK